MSRVYFPNLNGVRFLAALLVIFSHVEQLRAMFGLNNLWDYSAVRFSGKIGVYLFFVLSGFLITYLLLEERDSFGRIAVGRFYARRALRIWPIYYLIVFASLFLFPRIPFLQLGDWSAALHEGFAAKLLCFVLFLPNLAAVLYSPVPYASQTWSIGVEEQFYLIWPWLVRYTKRLKFVLFAIVLSFVFMNLYGYRILRTVVANPLTMDRIHWFIDSFNIDCMAVGGVFAILLRSRSRVLRVIYHPATQVVVFAGVAAILLSGIQIPRIHNTVIAFLFGVLIVNLAGNPKSLLNLENPILHYLGKISYGLYIYQPLCIACALQILVMFGIKSSFASHIGSLLLTIGIATLSYKFIETPFFRWKKRFTQVASGDAV